MSETDVKFQFLMFHPSPPQPFKTEKNSNILPWPNDWFTLINVYITCECLLNWIKLPSRTDFVINHVQFAHLGHIKKIWIPWKWRERALSLSLVDWTTKFRRRRQNERLSVQLLSVAHRIQSEKVDMIQCWIIPFIINSLPIGCSFSGGLHFSMHTNFGENRFVDESLSYSSTTHFIQHTGPLRFSGYGFYSRAP